MDHNTRSHSIDMLNGPLLGRIIGFALPLAASSMLQQLFNTADVAVVGRFASPQDMAAVGSNSSVINLIISLFVGLSVGANVVIARLIGQDRRDRINAGIGTICLVALISGFILLFAGMLAAPPILAAMQTPADVMGPAVTYLRIYFLGMPFIMFYNFGSAILRSEGDSRRPLMALTIAGIINVALNLLLVIVFHMGAAGVGIATVISNAVSAAFIFRFLTQGPEDFRLRRSCLRLDSVVLKVMLRIGLPAGIQGMIFSLSNAVIQSAVNSFGSYAAAGSAASQNLEYVCYYAINAFNQAATTFTGQNFAAKKYDRCRNIYRDCLLSGAISCAIVDLILILASGPVLGFFSQDSRVLEFARIRMFHVLAFQGIAASYEVTGSTLRGMGWSMTPTVLTIFGCVLFRIFWVYVIFPIQGTYSSLMYIYLASWILTGTLVMTAYFIIARRTLRV